MFKLETFGGLTLRTEAGERVEALAGRTKCLALLAYLAAEVPDGRVPREEVAALLWSGRTDDRARRSLRMALTHIRKATDITIVAGEGESTLGLARDHVQADVVAFQQALESEDHARALESYRGDFLAGIKVEGARDFQRWASKRRGEYRRRAYEAALALGMEARQAGDLAEAEERFRAALDLAPLREEAAQKLIRTLADRGRPADALQLYDAFRRRRETELELPPSDELDELVDKLKEAPPAASTAVEEAEPADEGVSPENESSPTEEFGPSSRPASGGATDREPPRSVRFFRRRILLGALVAVGLGGAVVAGAWHLLGGSGETAPQAGDRSIAVLPFEAVGTEDPGPIAEGLHNDLLTRLSNVSGLKVISATSVEEFRDTDLLLPAVADSLGVKWVLEGDVQRAGDAIQVNAQLVDPRTDTHAWAENYRRELTAGELFDLQSEITRTIARSLEAQLTAEEQKRVERQPTRDLEAYRLYAQGRAQLNTRTAEALRQAMGYFQQAIRRDSSFALAWAGLADARALYSRYGEGSLGDSVPGDEEAARRALALDPHLAEAHASLGLLHSHRGEGPPALRHLGRAVELKPSYAQAHHWLAYTQLHLGRLERARKHIALAVDLNPRHAPARWVRIHTLIASRQAEKAESHVRRAQQLAGDVPATTVMHAVFLYHTGRWSEFDSLIRERWAEGDVKRRYLALSAAQQGDTARARSLLDEMSEGSHLDRGLVLAALGNEDAAFAALEKTEDLTSSKAYVLRYYFPGILDPLRDDPRYRQLIREINRAWGLNPDGSLPESVDVSFGAQPDD